MSAETENVRKDAIINSATEQVRSLLETHFRDIAKSAEVGFVGDENQTEPVCKVKLAVEWPTLSQAAKVGVKIGWSVQFRDESEEEVDPLQSKLGLPEPFEASRKAGMSVTIRVGGKETTLPPINPKVVALAKEIADAPQAVRDAARHIVSEVAKANSEKNKERA
jgi:hypothetical protein